MIHLPRQRAAVVACALALVAAAATPAEARRHHTVRHQRAHLVPPPGGIVRVDTKAGTITVARDAAARFQGFIADVVARGFKGRVNCYARGGHVSHSLHYSGEACDFAQRGWGRTVRPMYHVADLVRKWGLRDGCSFRDCGHVDTGRPLRKRYAGG